MKLMLILLALCFICSCSEDNIVDSSNTETPATSTLLDAQMDALEKAKGVEQSLQDMTNAREQEMRQEGI